MVNEEIKKMLNKRKEQYRESLNEADLLKDWLNKQSKEELVGIMMGFIMNPKQ